MLVIRRRMNESLLIGGNVEIEVLELDPSSVKLGIRAPREVRILRHEIVEIERANQLASRMPLSPGVRETLAKLPQISSHTGLRPADEG